MQKILNIAHRGFTKEFPDNSLEAFYAAIKLGIDGIECDVHETSDHRFVIFHDSELEGKLITGLSLQAIRKVKIRRQYQIPTLEETLDLCHNRIQVMLELKLVHSLDLFLEIVRARMRPSEVFITSFYPKLISDLADFAPKIRRGILTGFAIDEPLKLIESGRVKIMLPRFLFASEELVKTLHANGASIIVWECNAIEELRAAIKWGVDGIITDAPDALSKELK